MFKEHKCGVEHVDVYTNLQNYLPTIPKSTQILATIIRPLGFDPLILTWNPMAGIQNAEVLECLGAVEAYTHGLKTPTSGFCRYCDTGILGFYLFITLR